MWLKSVTLDGFKSYSTRTIVGPVSSPIPLDMRRAIPIVTRRMCSMILLVIMTLNMDVVVGARGISWHWGDQSVDAPTEALPFPNVHMAGLGYDILYGNPHSTYGTDPGFRSAIFDLKGSSPSTDGRFLFPAGTDTQQDVSCKLDWQTQVINSAAEYSASLAVSVSVSGGWGPVAFQGSADYKTVKSETSSASSQFTKTSAECAAYTVRLHPYGLPKFTEYFIQEVSSAVDASNITFAAMALIQQFGTHYAGFTAMGSRFGQQSQISTEAGKTMTSQQLKASAKASVGNSLSLQGSTEEQINMGSDFSKNCTSQSLFTIGSVPPPNGDALLWASQTIKDPAPIRMRSLSTIGSLLTGKLFPNLTGIYTLQKAWMDVWNNYCQQQLGVSSCSIPDELDDRCFGGWMINQNTRPGGQLAPIAPNPITGQYNCPSGYQYTEIWQGSGGYCIASTNLLSPLCLNSAFGGMYDIGSLAFNNVFTNQQSCPPGYNSYQVAPYILYVCLKPRSATMTTSLGGVFALVANGKNQWSDAKTFDCPLPFIPYSFISSVTFICLHPSNVNFQDLPIASAMIDRSLIPNAVSGSLSVELKVLDQHDTA